MKGKAVTGTILASHAHEPGGLDAERLMRRQRTQIQRFLSQWARDEGITEGDVA
ncbi:MAG: hypothetical protein ACP5XB_00655 [Isosphaeraceae bacterium]